MVEAGRWRSSISAASTPPAAGAEPATRTGSTSLEHPALEQLLAEYAGRGEWRRDTRSAASGPTATRRSETALALDDTLRDLYDDFAEGRNGGVPSPFTLEGMRVFDALAERAGTGRTARNQPGARRRLRESRGSPGDVSGSGGADPAGLLRWADEYGQHEVPTLGRAMSGEPPPPSSVPGRPAVRVPSAPLRRAPWGVNVVGYFHSEHEQDETARQFVARSIAGEVPALPVTASGIPTAAGQGGTRPPEGEMSRSQLNLICLTPGALPEFAREAGEEFFAGRYSIGLWFWHCRLREREREHSSLLEEIWAPSAHAAALDRALGNSSGEHNPDPSGADRVRPAAREPSSGWTRSASCSCPSSIIRASSSARTRWPLSMRSAARLPRGGASA